MSSSLVSLLMEAYGDDEVLEREQRYIQRFLDKGLTVTVWRSDVNGHLHFGKTPPSHRWRPVHTEHPSPNTNTNQGDPT